jgi:hypothetical protein
MKDRDAVSVRACADLAGRTGAREFQVGYTHDDPANPGSPHPGNPGWYAHAQYRGTRLMVEGFREPAAACDALAARLLTGAQCQGCGKLVTLSRHGELAQDSTLVTGVTWTKEEQAAAGLCRWRLNGGRWAGSCG